MARSPFPKSFFTHRASARRAAFRASARAASMWRRAAEAGDYHLMEKPPRVANSGRMLLHADYVRFLNRAAGHLQRRSDFAAIEWAHRRAVHQQETPGLIDLTILDGLRLRASRLERLVGVA